ncbi:MAG: restriction endonuclease subunit S [Saprospiraceae bacterium]
MSRIEKLISTLCPNGVEWTTIDNVCSNIVSGGTPATSRSEYYGGDIPWLRTQEVDWKDITETSIKITDEGLRNSSTKWIPANCVIVAMYGATAAKVAINKIPLTTNQACCNLEIDEEKAHYKFIYYWLCNEYRNLKALGEGSQSNINGQKIKNYEIPIPPLPIQHEIVSILDKFTILEAELEAELEARRKQYEFYRNELLNFEEKEVEWQTLGEVASYSKDRINTSSINRTNYVGVDNLLQNRKGKTTSNYVPEKGSLIGYQKNDILIGNIRPYLKKIWKSTNNGGTNGDVLVVRINPYHKNILNSDYLYYHLASDNFFEYNMQFAKGAKMPRGDKSAILKFTVPIPAYEEQMRVVAILEKFDALVNDMSVGLPAEIEARRKQYEYYRGRLLTFKPLNKN